MVVSSMPKLVIEGIHTTMPMSFTNPKTSIKVSNLDTFNQDTFNKNGHILLCYNKLGSEESGWFHSGWIKDTLGLALSEHPILAGRFQTLDDGEGGFEIRSNDAGIRVMEVNAPVSLLEFLSLMASEREEASSLLLHFQEVDEENLHFSPLSCIQVTSFKCGGYSIGMSYNLLLADPFLMGSFVKRWAEIHNNTILLSDIPKMPLFYLPNLKRMGNPPSLLVPLKPSKDITTNVVLFEVAFVRDPSFDACNSIALQCVEEAESKAGIKMTPNFTLLVKEVSGNIRVDVTSKPSLLSRKDELMHPTKCVGWDDLATSGVAFWKGNAPTLVSHYVGSLSREGLVFLVILRQDEGKLGMKVLVTFPN